jgi:hypothetical protein
MELKESLPALRGVLYRPLLSALPCVGNLASISQPKRLSNKILTNKIPIALFNMTHGHESGAQGYTDEVAVEAHDLIQQAEDEEERMHPEQHQDDIPTSAQRNTSKRGSDSSDQSQSQGGRSAVDKVKETLNLRK